MTKEISLTQDQVALIDDEDYEWINQWKWHANYDKKVKNYYVKRTKRLKEIDGKRKIKIIPMISKKNKVHFPMEIFFD